MYWLGLVAGASMALFNPNASVVDEMDTPAETEIVEGQRDFYDRMTVPVMIEGQGPFRFMVDTGAQATVVTRGLSEKLKLEPIGNAMLVGMASQAQVQVVELDGLEFAARVIDNIHAPLLEARNVGADGILGVDSLQGLRVLIDFRNERIEVADSEALGGNSGYEIIVRARRKLGRLIITEAEVDGVETAVIIDTGAQGSIGNLALQRRLRAKRGKEITTTDVHGAEILGHLDLAREVTISRLHLRNVPITYADGPAFGALGLDRKPALVLGMRDLRLFNRVALDFDTRKVLFDLPPGVRTRQVKHPSRL